MKGNVSYANRNDIPHIVRLLNLAYRGEGSKAGWTTEAHIIKGDTRTDENEVSMLMEKAGSCFLKYIDEEGRLHGCVNLQQQNDTVYLGMLAVHPLLQGAGIGKMLMKAAEKFALERGCQSIYMTVIESRKELIEWYLGLGYEYTGLRKPFEVAPQYGVPVQPLQFIILKKNLVK